MSKQDFSFSGISIAYSVVKDYYPVNYKNPYFDHFVFQPMIGDGTCADNVYTMAAYAADEDGTVLNGEAMLAAIPFNHPVPAKKHIQFANLHLDLTALGKLYPPGGTTTELRIYPSGTYYCGHNGEDTAYMVYFAETGTKDGPDLITKTPINPSPPYHG